MVESPAIAGAWRRYVWETAPVLALKLDASQCVTDANAQALRILGAHTIGRPLSEFITAPDLPARLRQEDQVHLLTLNTASGMPETMWFRFFSMPAGTLALGGIDLKEQQELRNEVLGLNGELNNLTRQLHQANAELRELNQLKNQFLGMAAHDLRAPAGVVINYTEFVLDEAGSTLSAEHREFLETSLAAATGMLRLIENFLDLAVIESGKLRLEPAPTSVPEILDGLGPVARLIAGKKKITLLLDPGHDARRLSVDAPKLRQALLNFINNAVQHSVPGQRVWVSVRWEPAQVVFAVRDEGQGISPEDQARLFTAFGRAGTKKTAGERSTGLGLAIARQVIDAHGGRLWVESRPGEGATFLISLPLPAAQAQSDSTRIDESQKQHLDTPSPP